MRLLRRRTQSGSHFSAEIANRRDEKWNGNASDGSDRPIRADDLPNEKGLLKPILPHEVAAGRVGAVPSPSVILMVRSTLVRLLNSWCHVQERCMNALSLIVVRGRSKLRVAMFS